MKLQLMLQDEHAEGRAEGRADSIVDILSLLGEVPENLRERIYQEVNMETLKKWICLAAKAESIEQFIKEM